MTISGAVPANEDRVKDKPIYLRIGGSDDTKSTSWYVIEEKQSSLSFVNEVAGCKSEKDTVIQLPIPENGNSTNNVAVINSRVYLIGGESYTRLHAPLDDGSLGYYHLDLNMDSGVEEWRIGGGKHAEPQYRGGVSLGHDGSVYSVGPNIYRLRPGADSWERLPTPPQGRYPRRHDLLRWTSFLGITKNKLYIYACGGGGGLYKASAMLSFDFQSNEWDEEFDEFLYGDWSPGVVLCNDRYLVSFGTRSPRLRPEEVKLLEARRWGPMEVWEEEVPGLYVFDLQKRQWLPERVQGLPNDGTVIPQPHRRIGEVLDVSFSPQLFQIREDNDHYLALLWDSFGESCNCEITWCKFMLDVCTTTGDDDVPRFTAHSLSRGFCSLDEGTGDMFNCVVGMDVCIGI